MPDIITHLVVGEKALEEGEYTSVLKENRNLFFLGCQGPDIFYYHKYLVFRIDKLGVKLAVQMHTKRTGEFLKNCFQCVSREKNTFLFVYFSGFLLHYLTDRFIHPYVFYRSGRHPPDSPERWEHKKLETSIDIEILNYYLGIPFKRYPYIRMVKVDEREYRPCFACLAERIPRFYNVDTDIENLIVESYQHFLSALRFSRDLTGIKKNILFPVLSGIMGLKFNLSVFVHPDRPYYHDPLNLSKREWRHPVTGEVCNKSVPDLVDETLDVYKSLMKDIYAFYLGDKKSLPSFFETDYSYDTGLPVNFNQEMRFFERSQV